MATAEGGVDSWFGATVDVLLSVLGFLLVWYPLVSVGNAVLGTPVSAATVDLVVGVLALGSAYPVVAGDWSLGRVGEFAFVLVAAAVGWGLVGMVLVLASGVRLSGGNPAPQAAVWAAAYLTAYVVVYRTELSLGN